MKITNNIEMLEVNSNGNKVNLILAWDKNSLVLVDAGYPGQTDAIVQAITSTDFSAEKITHIILTHQDFDHVGCLRDLIKLCPKAQIIAHAEEAPYIRGEKALYKVMTALEKYDTLSEERKIWCEDRLRMYRGLTAPVSNTVNDSDVLPLCGGIEIIHTPGHTIGHICLLFKDGGILVSGDALGIKEGNITGPSPQATADMETALLSVEKVKKYPFNAVVAYHGGYLKIK